MLQGHANRRAIPEFLDEGLLDPRIRGGSLVFPEHRFDMPAACGAQRMAVGASVLMADRMRLHVRVVVRSRRDRALWILRFHADAPGSRLRMPMLRFAEDRSGREIERFMKGRMAARRFRGFYVDERTPDRSCCGACRKRLGTDGQTISSRS